MSDEAKKERLIESLGVPKMQSINSSEIERKSATIPPMPQVTPSKQSTQNSNNSNTDNKNSK
jgi:hypothetical protein